jgi:hypothetical protein
MAFAPRRPTLCSLPSIGGRGEDYLSESSHLHEDLNPREAVKAGSNRSFGLVFAGAMGVLAALAQWRGHDGRAIGLAIAGVLFLAAALVAPSLLGPLNRLWFKFGLALNKIVSPAVMLVLFYGAITPVAALVRLRHGDPLRLRRDPKLASYWIDRVPPGPAPGSMRNQF